MSELKIALVATNFFWGEKLGWGTDQGEKQTLSMLALFTCTKFAGRFADEIGKGGGLVILDEVETHDTAPQRIFSAVS